MSLIFKDRVKCETNTIGLVDYSLGPALIGYETFQSSFSDGDETCYCVTNGSDYEILTGIYSVTTNSLSRGSIVRSSNNNNPIDWSAGTKTVFCTMSSAYALTEDQVINLVIEEATGISIAMAIALG